MSMKTVFSFCHWVSLIELSSWFNKKFIFFQEYVQSLKISRQLKVFSVLLQPCTGDLAPNRSTWKMKDQEDEVEDGRDK